MTIETSKDNNIMLKNINLEDKFTITLSFNNNFKGNPYKRMVVIEKYDSGRERNMLFIRPDKKLIGSANEQGHFWLYVIESH